jgi:phage terminase Nu1 subunit (DNA packaging protein)
MVGCQPEKGTSGGFLYGGRASAHFIHMKGNFMVRSFQQEDLAALNGEQLGRLLGLTTRQLRNLTVAGMPSVGLGKQRRYVWRTCFDWYVARKVAELAPKNARGDANYAFTLVEQQTRKTQADAARAEIKLAKERGEVVAVEEVKQAQIKVNSIIRTRLLGVPTKVAPLVANKGLPQAKAVLESEIREVLTNLAKAGDELS